MPVNWSEEGHSPVTQPPLPPPVIVVAPAKSVGISLLLTFFFGPLGMLYSTVPGALIMLVVSVVVGFVTFGFGLLVTHPICMIWGAVSAHRFNQRMLAASRV